MSKLATPTPAIDSDMSHVIDDATYAIIKTDDIIETDDYDSPPRYELPIVHEGYVMDKETARDFFACNDRSDLKKLLAKLKKL